MKTHAKRDSEELEIFKRHLAHYESMSLVERKHSAKESLIRSGVLNQDGTVKNQIVTR